MDQKIINLFDRFTHGGMNRRDFMEKLSLLAGSTAAATALLPVLENNYARADILPEGDFRQWDVIDAWAKELAEEIGGKVAVA